MNAVQDSYESLTGSLGSVTADPKDLVNRAADKRECELLAIEPLAQIKVGIIPLGHNISLKLGMVPDSGAMVTAIPATHAKGVRLTRSDVILRDAMGEKLKTLGVFEASVSWQQTSTTDEIYVVDGLSHALMSRQMMKDLGLLHQDFPHQNVTPKKADKEDQSCGVVQALAAEVEPPETEPKKVRFGPPEPVHASEVDTSSDEDEPHHNRSNVMGQVHGTPTKGYKPTRSKQTGGPQTMKEAIKPRPEAALVCGQNLSKRPTGPHLRVDIRRIAVPTRSNVAPLVLRGGFIGQKNPTAVRSEDVFDAGHTCGPTAMKAKKTTPRPPSLQGPPAARRPGVDTGRKNQPPPRWR